MNGELLDLHPLTLSFRDADLEREFWRSSVDTRRTSMQVGTVVLGVLYAVFGLVDSRVFGEQFPLLAWLRYGVFIPLMLAAWPVVLLPRFRAFMERRSQEVLLWLGVVATSGILVMGAFIAPHATVQGVLVGSLGMLVTLTFLYGMTQLRFFYSAVLGLLATGTGSALLLAFLHAPAFVWVGIYGVAVNASGFWLGRTLEVLVRRDFAQKRAVEAEKERSEGLLANALPAEIARRLRDDDAALRTETAALAERHEAVTVLVADLVGFTPLAEQLPPEQLAALLDRLFSAFDELCTAHGVEKIKTLGDAWIAAAGVPRPREDHAVCTARLAIDMLAALDRVRADAPRPIAMRIGIDTGAAVAGVIGRMRFAYDLWGEAVDGAKAMEHAGAPGRVRVSDATEKLLRGKVAVRSEPDGQGGVAHWLEGEVPVGGSPVLQDRLSMSPT